MEEITNLSFDSITLYFNTLKQFGYKDYEDVYKLLALLGLEEMLDIFAEFVTEQDLRDIMGAINCLSGSTCLIDFPTYFTNGDFIHKSKVNYLLRISEANAIRIDNTARLVE